VTGFQTFSFPIWLIELAPPTGAPDTITVIVADVLDDHAPGPPYIDPFVDGAAGDNVGQRQVARRSAAGRAALADPPPPPQPPPTVPTGGGPSARRRPLRLLLVAVALLVVLVAGSIGTYTWALGHWFVGVADTGEAERVAVFRGVDVSILGLDLFRLDETTDLAVTDLTPAARNRVRDGITSDGTAHTDRILDALRDQRLPLCHSSDETMEEDGATPTAGSSAGGSASRSPATGSASPATTAPPSGTRTAPTTTAPERTPSTPRTTTESRTTSSPEPGKDCREEK